MREGQIVAIFRLEYRQIFFVIKLLLKNDKQKKPVK